AWVPSVRSGLDRLGPRAGSGEHVDAGKLLALEVLQAGAAAGGDVPEGVLVEAELADRGRGVAAADHGQPVDRGQRLCDGAGATGERVELEDAHRAVPEHRPGIGERLGETAPRLRADVQAERVRRDLVRRYDGRLGVRLELGGDHDVGGQQDLHAG